MLPFSFRDAARVGHLAPQKFTVRFANGHGYPTAVHAELALVSTDTWHLNLPVPVTSLEQIAGNGVDREPLSTGATANSTAVANAKSSNEQSSTARGLRSRG